MKPTKPFFAFAATLAILGTPRFAVAEDGYAFDVTMSGTKNGKTQPAATFKTFVVGPKARIDIPMTRDDWKKGDYLLTTDSGRTFTLVSPSRKTIQTYDEANLRALMEKENKGVTIGDPETSWAFAGPNQAQYLRRYEIKFKQGLLSGKGKFDERHDFTLAPADAPGPAFNPLVNYSLLELGSLLLKNPKFAAQGLSSVLPKGFVQKVTLTIKTEMKALLGGQKEDVVQTLYSSAPTRTDIPAAAFVAPAHYKIVE